MSTIVINHYGTNYILECKEVYTGEIINRYEVTAGAKTILLERKGDERVFQKRWKIVSVNWAFKDKKVAAQFINEVMVQIDLQSKAKKDADKK